ncbi:MAG TPA: hypothetical protein LFW21_07595 [Rickettsia endosymbiont of Pyrocoelia pectoralis]|nr:hypothetical protein [Rickettsia endosymbiont of Pyrocoelia pectoralis]
MDTVDKPRYDTEHFFGPRKQASHGNDIEYNTDKIR